MIATESIIAQPSIARRRVGSLPPSIARARAGNLHRWTDATIRSPVRFRSSIGQSPNKTLHQTHSAVTASQPKNQSNQQYSIIALTDAAGSIVERYTYTAYGAPTFLDASGTPISNRQSSIFNRITYTGREWDSTLHLHHFRARMMDPQLGRFCGRDPIGYVDGYNLYNLVHNGPLDSVDPHGLCEEKWIGSACIKCRVMVKGRTFGEYSAPCWGLPWNKSAFFTGDLHAVCSFVDQVQCCCPSKKVSVSFNFHLHLSFYDYRLYSWGTVIVHAARSIYLPMWANWIITAAMNKDLFGMFEDAMKADQRMKA